MDLINNNNNNNNKVCNHLVTSNGVISCHKSNHFYRTFRTNQTNCVPVYLLIILFIFTTFTSGIYLFKTFIAL